MKEQDGNQPFLMCCHFKATHEPYDYPIRMEHLYDGVTFPEPENLLDWGPETNGRSFKGQTLEELERRWRIASQDPDKCGVATPDCRSAPKDATDGRQTCFLPKSLSVTTSVAALPSTTTSANS